MFAAVLFAVSLVAFVCVTWQRWRQQPPGPWGVLVLGNVLQIDLSAVHAQLAQWARTYGSIYQVRAGQVDVVVVSDPDILREAMSKTEVAGRPETCCWAQHPAGIVRAEGELWQETRRVTKALMDSHSAEEIEFTIRELVNGFMNGFLLNNVDRVVELGRELDIAAANIMWYLISGELKGPEDPSIIHGIDRCDRTPRTTELITLEDALPWATSLIHATRSSKKPEPKHPPPPVEEDHGQPTFEQQYQEILDYHKETFDPDSEPRDFIDIYLTEMTARPLLFTEKHLHECVLDLLTNGSEMIGATLYWLICFLCARPDAQLKIHQEIDKVIGKKKPPSLGHREKMPFTEAVILETLRRGDITPVGLPLRVNRDITLAGYKVTRGSQIVPLLHGAHTLPEFFSDAEHFKPERFINTDGRLIHSTHLIPFLIGKRQCPAEDLAMQQLFLFTTSIMQQFTLRFPDGFRHVLSPQKDTSYHVLKPATFKFIPEIRTEASHY